MASLIGGLGGSAGFGEESMPRNDDSPSIPIDLTSVFGLTGLNFFGATYTGLFLNYNGSISFSSGITSFSPTTISGNTSVPIIAPFWADVDIRNTTDPSPGTNLIWWDLDVANKTFTATWDDVGYYSQHNDKTNAFQLRLVGKDTPGDFDIYFYYESINWLTGDASGGTGGMGGNMARAGYSSGNGKNFKEITESGTAAMANLESLGNAGAGIFLFEVRNGVVPLFTSAGDTVDFNNLTEEQKASIAANNDVYHGKGGSDTVVLPDPANYDQVVGKDKDNNDITLNWESSTTFFTESRAGDTYLVAARAGNHVIVAGAGNDAVTIDGNGNNTITAGSGSTSVVMISGGGNNTIVGGTGKANIDIDTTGTGINLVAGSDGKTSIKVKRIGSGLDEITTGAGETTIVMDRTDASGSSSIKTGAAKSEITITSGRGRNTIEAGAGELSVAIKATGGNENNTILLGAGQAKVTFTGVPTVHDFGIQQVLAGSGQAAVTFEGTFLNSSVKGGLVNTSPATFTDITVKDSTATLYLHGGLTIDALRLDKDAKVAVLDSGVVKISHVASDDGLTLNAGTIDVGAFATLELTNEFYGKVNLGSGSSTLILNQPVGFGFTAKTGTSQTLEFQLGNLITGDKIVLKGINQSSPIFSASLGDHKLADGTTQFILQLAGLGDIAVGSINGGMGFSNNAYFDVALSANKQDTVLTLKEGNNFDAALLGPQARSTHGVSGTGIKIGIISDSFANNRAGLTRDLTYGVIPGVNVLSDALDGYVFSGGLDEGRTMAGIVHAIAPHATLYFHAATNAFNFDDAINALRAAKVDIIVDDLGFGRPAEYLSSMNSVINSAVRSGITFVTAAGNDRPSLPIYGHSANPNVVAVAAMNVLATPTLAAPGGHYLPADTETFSSLGTNGKPDVTGVDAGQTSFPLGVNGLSPFYGTSAAAPSVAAVVALMMDANPLLRALPKEVARILEATALAFGTASDAGAGLVQAERAVAMAITHRENFFDATGNPVQGASLAVPDGLSATPLQPVSAALSVPVGNAGTGVTVMMLVEMGQAVTVSGLPSFTLNSGGLFTYDADHSSLGHGRLMFNYTVSGPDQAPLLAITGFSGTIEDLSGNDADFSALFGKATGLTVNSPLTVTSIASSQVGVVQAGQTIELTITLNHGATLVSAGGLPSLTLNVGAIATFDAASSNLAAGKLVFDYTVAAGQATPSLTIASVDLPGGSTIKDVNGNNADFALAIDQNMGVQIGPAFVAAVLPQVEQTAIGSGQTVEVIIAVSQGVVVDISKGAPTLTLGNGAIATYDAATSDPSKGLLVFDYKVGAGDQAASNLLVGTVALNGATIRDWSGLDVDLSGSQNTPTGLTIGSPLTVASTAPSKTGVLNLGESVQITLTMSGGLQAFDANAGGLSTFTLSGGGTAFYDPAASDPGAGKLVFAYTVVGSDQSIANLAITQFNQNGGIYFDGKGNFADFSGALNVPLGLQVVVPDPATVTIAAASAVKAEGNGGTTAFTFNVTLSKALGTTATMSWSVTGGDGNSVGTTDFVGGTMPGDTLSFAAGETVKTVTVAIQGDTTAEADEIFTVTLSHATGSVVLGTPSATGTIQNDEATVAIAASSASKAEGNAGSTAFTFTLTRGGDTSASQSVAWSVAGSGANPASAADFAGGISPSGSATFAAGETSRIITIAVQGDTAGEANEGFAVTLSNPSPGLTVTTASAAGTIQNDDASVSIAATDASKLEGNAGSTAFTFTLTRSGDTSASQSVAWAVAGSGAAPANAVDFAGGALSTGSVTFAASETARVITIAVQGDTTGEGNEGFTVTLSNPSPGLSIGTASASGTILSDDTAVSIAAAGASKAEGNGGTTAFTFTVTRSGDTSQAQSVAWSVAGSGASPASAADFVGGAAPTGSLTFAIGETVRTVTVNVQGDTTGEANEDFTVTLANASAGLAIGTASATGTIQDDDTSVSIAATSASKPEGNSGTTAFTFTVTRSGNTAAAGQSVSWAVAGSGASPAVAADFAGGVLPTGNLAFAAGETAKIVTVNVQGDTASEPGETFAVTLSNASAGLAIAGASATGTIQNDDAVPLVAHGDAYVVLRGSTIVASAANGVLFNDDGSGLTASLETAPAFGNLQLAANGGFTYTPLFNFSGVVSFTYRASSAGASADAQAVLFVVPTVTSPTSITLDLLALSPEQQIAATYAAFFGRAADADGFDFWVGEFVGGLPTQGPAALFSNIASSFGISAEAQALYPFLANPFGASNAQITAFLDSVYNNLFNRSSDADGLAYWTGEIRNALANGQFVGSVLVNIMSGAQDTAAGNDITTLMGKVAVSIDYVSEQREHDTQWAGAADIAAATSLLDAVTSTPQSILTGIRTAEILIANHA